MDAFLENLGTLIENSGWLAPLLALLAGVLTSFTPCALSSVPLIIGYVGGASKDNPKIALKLSLVFAAGNAITYAGLAVVAALVGKLANFGGSWWYFILGALMIFMALQIWEIINVLPSANLVEKNKKRGYAGALITGILSGLFSSPCATPVLVVLLAIVAESGKLFFGILLMLLYAIGHSILIVVAGTSTSFVSKIKKSENYRLFNNIFKIIMGLLILALGLYMFYLAF